MNIPMCQRPATEYGHLLIKAGGHVLAESKRSISLIVFRTRSFTPSAHQKMVYLLLFHK